MSIRSKLQAFLKALAVPFTRPLEPEQVSSRDWADLPIYHPRCEEC